MNQLKPINRDKSNYTMLRLFFVITQNQPHFRDWLIALKYNLIFHCSS